ncbi:probable serine/threonine-protein kinase PBL1 [Impatiens glandulifera]|uniref:probable serine/threonine-protein kinase PBL1 n=1 Tax=Impatiens glandulifera TaxID=253017 RepID=UPI001FB12CA4|nr:probable serine/threonine-protein kinase PBL1 [Impatiens glandulifera]XP_047322234.1 probable serine/threonine-protein kinase PBL1 [Impatiens glandulifera]
MGCFTVLKYKKKRNEQGSIVKRFITPEHSSAALPEPNSQSRSLQSAPPSFRTRVKPVQQANKVSNSRTRALSAPCSLDTAEEDALSSVECEEQEDSRSRIGSIKEYHSQSPQPLPLPEPQAQNANVLKNLSSFKSSTSSGPLNTSGPLPLPPQGTIRNFSFEEIAMACHNFSQELCLLEGLSSSMYIASFGDDTSTSRKQEAVVTRLHNSPLVLRDFVNEVNKLSSLQHSNLCKLLGFHARDGSDKRMLVYERLFHGSLDRLLYGRSDGPPIDWNARMKVALCAAQGLTFLHEEGPFQAMYSEFSTANIQIDKDFRAKLSGFGCVSHLPENEIPNSSVALATLSMETLERGLVTPKSNVWSFGIVLLEILTGRKNLDSSRPKEERNLVKWSKPYLADDSRLSLIMDPQLKARFPIKAARAVADICQKCLQKESMERPTMRTIVEHLKVIQDIKYSCRFPLQEPGTAARKQISKSLSMNGIVISPMRRSTSSASLTGASKPFSSAPIVLPLPPLRTCSSILMMEGGLVQHERRKSVSSSAGDVQGPSVEGF